MDVSLVSNIEVKITIDGKDYLVTAIPKSIRPIRRLSAEKHTGDLALVKEALVSCNFGDDWVNVTRLGKFLEGRLANRTLGHVLNLLGYDTVFKMKYSQGVNHYFRYSSILTTEAEVVQKAKGR